MIEEAKNAHKNLNLKPKATKPNCDTTQSGLFSGMIMEETTEYNPKDKK